MEFVDTVATKNVTTELPAEAMQINGKYIEDQIDGYRTLYVKGRESLLAELNTYEVGVRDGTGVSYKRLPARELVIGYMLKAESNTAFREAYNTLNGILNTDDAEIIFRDEDDKYFTGTPTGVDEIEAGRNCVQGEITIYCSDPLKYSVKEYTVTATLSRASGSAYFKYNGTYKCRPVLEATLSAASGYVRWWLSNERPGNKYVHITAGDTHEEESDTPHTFVKNDKVVADCMSGRMYLNGEEQPGLNDIENSWEDFYFEEYDSGIFFYQSSWSRSDTKIVVRYHEVFI